MIKKVQNLHKTLTEQEESLSDEDVNDTNDNSTAISVNETQEDPVLLCGLMDEPLLSLEKSLQGVLHIISDLKNYIDMCMVQSRNPVNGLTQNESAAIRIYTIEMKPSESCLYRSLNRDLKSASQEAVQKWFPYLRLFLHGLNKLPSYQGTVWRGVRRDLSSEYMVGALGTWWIFASTTIYMAVLESDLYLGQVGARTLFSIECTNGKRITNHSHFKMEDEILLLPGFYYEVVAKFQPEPDVHIIHLK